MSSTDHHESSPSVQDIVIMETAKGCRQGMKPDDVQYHYNCWSEDGKYDEDYTSNHYKGPATTAAAVLKYTKEERDASILDVAAGSGLVGERLKELGFRQVDALDPSEGMLQVAMRKNIYRKYFNTFFTRLNKVIPRSTYDVLVCCGGMMNGHLACDSLKEMIYCVKKGGLVVIVMREEYLWTVPEYKDRLEPHMEQLQDEGQWIRLERTHIPSYFCGYDGLLFVFKVTKTSNEY